MGLRGCRLRWVLGQDGRCASDMLPPGIAARSPQAIGSALRRRAGLRPRGRAARRTPPRCGHTQATPWRVQRQLLGDVGAVGELAQRRDRVAGPERLARPGSSARTASPPPSVTSATVSSGSRWRHSSRSTPLSSAADHGDHEEPAVHPDLLGQLLGGDRGGVAVLGDLRGASTWAHIQPPIDPATANQTATISDVEQHRHDPRAAGGPTRRRRAVARLGSSDSSGSSSGHPRQPGPEQVLEVAVQRGRRR